MIDKKSIVFSVGMLLASLVLLFGYTRAVTPAAIAHPTFEHAHMRLQIIVSGTPIDFSTDAFQSGQPAVCSDQTAAEPIHFHDHKDQFVHLHWKGLTGGVLLKNYGWNLIGGPATFLGYRQDQPPFANPVPIYGNVLPPLAPSDSLWIYSGDEHGYQPRDTNQFLQQDLETFLGRKSLVQPQASRDIWRDILFSRAAAHGNEHSTDQGELTRINNLLGNIVIFAQKDRPTADAVAQRFAALTPLSASTCGG